MTFVVGLVIRGDGSDADAALKKTGAAVKQLGDETDKAGRKTTAAGAAQKRAAGDAEALARANRTAATSFTNLNTAAVTSESGLRSALRQGARIGQVLGPAGAGGALKSLGVGLLAVANPMNFIAAATITAGAALIGWLSGAGDAAKEAEDRLKALQDRVSSLDGVLGRIEAYDFDSKLDGMGAAAVEIRREFENILSVVEKVQAKALEAALDGLRDQSGLEGAIKSFNYQDNIAGRLETDAPTIDVLGLDHINDAKFALFALRQLGGDTKADILASLDAVTEMLLLRGVLTDEVQAYLATIAEELGLEKAITEEVRGRSEARKEVRGPLDALLAENEQRALARQYGEESVQLALERADAEYEAYDALVSASDESDEMKQQLRDAYLAAQGIALADMASGIGAAAAQAMALANAMGIAYATAVTIAALGPQGIVRPDPSGKVYSGRGSVNPTVADSYIAGTGGISTERAEIMRNLGKVARAGGAAGGGGGAAARTEADAIGELIARLKGENEVARETDPVQRKLLELRKEMTGATGAQRAEVEALIRGNLAEADAMEAVRDRMETVREIGRDAVGSILSGLREGATLGDIFVGVLDRIADKLLDLASDQISGALFGSGDAGGGMGFLGEALSGLLFPNSKPKIAAKAATGRVIDTPTLFGMGGGAVGLMAEAGAEAIMPLTHAFGGGVGAMIGGQETALPLTRLASGKLGVDLGAVAQPFAMGGAFGDIAGTAAPTARAATGRVIDTPTLFGMGGGAVGLMAEAGAEAIMPLTHSFGGGVGAMIGGQETALPLTRLASGKLGVDLGAVAQPFAMGGAFGDIAATQAPASWRQAMAAGRGGAAPATIILTPTIVNTTGRPLQMEVEETVDARGQRQQRYIVSDLTGQGLTTPGGAGRRALRQQFGLGPQARSRG